MAKKSITFTKNADESYTFGFINGSILLPPENGAYVISSGCGAGKSTAIKELIRQEYDNGIFYAVDSVASLIDMYEAVKKKLIVPGFLKDSDVAILYSAETKLSDSVNMKAISLGLKMKETVDQYKAHPEELMNKKIVLITHARFWIDYIPHFLIYKTPMFPFPFDGNFSALMRRTDLRQWVIFDETPTFINPYFSVPHYMLPGIVDWNGTDWVCKSKADIDKYYKSFVKDSKEHYLPSPLTALGRKKYDLALEVLPKYAPLWVTSTDTIHDFFFKPVDLVQSKTGCKLLVLEGAGDVILNGSKFKLLDMPNKYTSGINWIPFSWGMKRKEDLNSAAFNDYIDWLVGIIKSTRPLEKTLVVVWMTVGKNASDTANEETIEKSPFADKVKQAILARGIPEYKFKITYYGASDTKGSNEYASFKNIVLSGKWAVPNSEAHKFNSFWGTSTAINNINLWLFVQLICRIGIRNHSSKLQYNVYYSNDFPVPFITSLQDYFKNKTVKSKSSPTETWKSIISSQRMNEQTRKKIIALATARKDIADAISTHSGKCFDFTTKDICSIVSPEKTADWNKVIGRSSFIEELRKLGVEIRRL